MGGICDSVYKWSTYNRAQLTHKSIPAWVHTYMEHDIAVVVGLDVVQAHYASEIRLAVIRYALSTGCTHLTNHLRSEHRVENVLSNRNTSSNIVSTNIYHRHTVSFHL